MTTVTETEIVICTMCFGTGIRTYDYTDRFSTTKITEKCHCCKGSGRLVRTTVKTVTETPFLMTPSNRKG